MAIIAIDIDGIICEELNGDYETPLPYLDTIKKINQLYDDGHQIWIFTARGSKTGIDWTLFTEKQLHGWGVKYHKLILGKPHYDVLVDDRAVSSLEELNIK